MIIATRILTLKRPDGDIEIPISISAPKHEGDAWSCIYEIGWPEGKESITAWGHDSAQALVVALQMIGAEIYSSAYHKSGDLMLDAPGGGYGFAVVGSIRDLLEGDDAKYL
jgi:hypothetical protein